MRWLWQNLGLKLLALITASALSAYVYTEINYPTPGTLFLPLRPANLAEGLVLASQLPETVTVSVRGPYRTIRRMRAANLRATVNLAELKEPGTERLPVTLPEFGDVTVMRQSPDEVRVEVDLSKTMAFPVGIERAGQLDPRFTVSDERIKIRTVRVSGPQALVDSVAAARVEPNMALVRAESVGEAGYKARLNVHLYNSEGMRLTQPTLTVEPPILDYFLSLVPVSSIRVLKVVPDHTGQPAANHLLAHLDAEPQYIPVPASVAPRDVAVLRTEPISLSGMSRSFTARPKLIYPFQPPPGSGLPEAVDVNVEIISIEDESLGALRLSLEAKGRRANMDYVLTPTQLRVVSEQFAALTEEQRSLVHATVDVEGLEPGEYTLTPQVRLPADVDSVRIIPSQVTLTVIEQQ